MPITIKNRWTDEPIATVEDTDDFREAVIRLIKSGVNLVDANLDGANLDGANLTRANLYENTTMPYGEKWSEYVSNVVPALLTAGGKSLSEVISTGCWECHEWANCPMHVAFGIDHESEAPVLLRPRVREFIQLFDAKLITCPVITEERKEPEETPAS